MKLKKSNNTQDIATELRSTSKMFPAEQVAGTVDIYQQYVSERNNADKFRFTFNINPVCTNVLFNPITEVMQKEGSPDGANVLMNYGETSILSGVTTTGGTFIDKQGIPDELFTRLPLNRTGLYREQAIRDTEYSHPDLGGFTYHCGTDIFSNYRLRLTEELPLQTRDKSEFEDEKYYGLSGDTNIECMVKSDFSPAGISKYETADVLNTISDVRRKMDSKKVHEEIPGQSGNTKQVLHVATNENFMPFVQAYQTNLQERDGWFGFKNYGELEIWHTTDDGAPVLVNKIMNGNKPCEQIDMYPDRSLYSFIPKTNPYRQGREERNWDVCMTFPYSSTTMPAIGDSVCDLLENPESGQKGIKVVYAEIYSTASNTEYLILRTAIKHGFQEGDIVELSWVNEENDSGETSFFVSSLEIFALGNEFGKEKDVYFQINAADLDFDWDTDNDGNLILPDTTRVVKQINDEIACEYYFRIFRKLPNMKYLGRNIRKADIAEERFDWTNFMAETPTLNEFYDDGLLKDDDWNYLASKPDLGNILGKQGFARNIYGDQEAQLSFIDTIDINHIRDNRNRPITEVFLTILKRNAGYEDWYYNNDTGSDSIEFSHCFGPVSSGLNIKFSGDDYDLFAPALRDYNIHCLHNVNLDLEGIKKKIDIPQAGIPLEENITIDSDMFLGDIVEYNPLTDVETTLENVYHRFNTAQREYSGNNSTYISLIYDVLDRDDYSFVGNEEHKVQGNSFSVKSSILHDKGTRGNIYPEGYFYQPHHKIQIREFSPVVEEAGDTPVPFVFESESFENGKYQMIVNTKYNHGFHAKDALLIRTNGKLYTATVEYVNKNTQVTIEPEDKFYEDVIAESTVTLGKMIELGTVDVNIYIPYGGYIPAYAQFVPELGRYLWRRVLSFDDTENTAIQAAPFTNGATYREANVTFFLRRQDPFGDYRLNYRAEIYKDMPQAEICTLGYSLSEEMMDDEAVEENDMTICN